MNLIEATAWAEDMDVRVTVCDLNATIVYMNKAAILGFCKYGGTDLIGKSLFGCHQPVSQEKIKEMLVYPQVNTYIITNETEGKQLIRQFPWMENGEHKGIIEISFDLPFDVEEKKG